MRVIVAHKPGIATGLKSFKNVRMSSSLDTMTNLILHGTDSSPLINWILRSRILHWWRSAWPYLCFIRAFALAVFGMLVGAMARVKWCVYFGLGCADSGNGTNRVIFFFSVLGTQIGATVKVKWDVCVLSWAPWLGRQWQSNRMCMFCLVHSGWGDGETGKSNEMCMLCAGHIGWSDSESQTRHTRPAAEGCNLNLQDWACSAWWLTVFTKTCVSVMSQHQQSHILVSGYDDQS